MMTTYVRLATTVLLALLPDARMTALKATTVPRDLPLLLPVPRASISRKLEPSQRMIA